MSSLTGKRRRQRVIVHHIFVAFIHFQPAKKIKNKKLLVLPGQFVDDFFENNFK